MTTRREVLQMTAAAAMALPVIGTDSPRIFATEPESPAPLITAETPSQLILMGTLLLPDPSLDMMDSFRTFRLAARTGEHGQHEVLPSGYLDRRANLDVHRDMAPFQLTDGQMEQVRYAMWSLDRLLKPVMFR